jgi:hypothetical protein
VPYAPDWDPTGEDFPDFTLDLSHTSVSQSDALDMAEVMGDRLSHVHIADGNGSARDEHLVPGRGEQPCAELLEGLAGRGFDGLVVVEVNTRKCEDRAEREADLAEALAFTRLNLAAPGRGGHQRLPPPGRVLMRVLRTPDERFADLPGFPYAPSYATTSDGLRMAYVDEGRRTRRWCCCCTASRPGPTSTARRCRCCWRPGFRVVLRTSSASGRSDKPVRDEDYTYARHVEWMRSRSSTRSTCRTSPCSARTGAA